MNKDNIGTPIFKIKNKGKNIDTISVSPDTEDGEVEIVLKKNEHSQLIPSGKERDILYITGASGSGKSYFALQYLKEYRLKYPKNPVYLISSLKEDETLDKFKDLKRIVLDQDFLDENFEIDDFKNSMIIFDDADCIQNKKMREKISGLLTIILETGRHTRTSCIFTSHLPASGYSTKRILNESHSITFFCAGLGARALKYLMESHLGLDKDQIRKIKRNKSRATTFVRSFPSLILFDKGAYLLNQED